MTLIEPFTLCVRYVLTRSKYGPHFGVSRRESTCPPPSSNQLVWACKEQQLQRGRACITCHLTASTEQLKIPLTSGTMIEPGSVMFCVKTLVPYSGPTLGPEIFCLCVKHHLHRSNITGNKKLSPVPVSAPISSHMRKVMKKTKIYGVLKMRWQSLCIHFML